MTQKDMDQAEKELTRRRQIKAAVAAIGIALGALLLLYNIAPRSEITECSLYTGQFRVQHTRLYIPVGSDLEGSELATWAGTKLAVAPEDDKWVPVKVVAYGWFGGHGDISYPSRVAGVGLRNLESLMALDTQNPKKAKQAIADYREMLDGLDVHDDAILPSDKEVQDSKGRASTPFTAFAAGLGVKPVDPRGR